MLDPSHPIAELLRKDRRYPFEAYVFVFEALNFAHSALGLGRESPGEPPAAPRKQRGEEEAERHVTGQELCEAIRRYALEQWGYMAKTVLNNWSIRGTSDFGEIVFNLIHIGHMRKTPQDRREDFDGVYDFDTAFRQAFKITRVQ